MAKTYKQRIIDAILLQKTRNNNSINNCLKTQCVKDNCTTFKNLILRKSNLESVYKRVIILPTKVFTPTRFPSSAFISVKLSIPDIINQIYNNESSNN